MTSETDHIRIAIDHLESQRSVLGDAVVDAAIAALHRQMAAAEAATDPDEQRKLATVLFADVSGFTAMSELMDAEDVRDTLNALWRRLDGVLLAHGGTIDKHLGDGVMAIFGAPTAHEDDPARAIYCALAMHRELARFAAESDQLPAGAPEIRLRIGINTGPVFLGALGTRGEYTAIGDAVNVASRLESMAPIGGTIISHNTYRHVRGLFSLEPLAPIQVRGKSETVQAYLVNAARPQTFQGSTRGLEGVETELVGRDLELTYLQRTFATVADKRVVQMMTLIGEAGIGKSRLAREFDRWLQSRDAYCFVFKGRATEATTNLPYVLLRDLLARQFEIQDSDSAAEVRHKLERGYFQLTGEADLNRAHYIGYLVGFDFMPDPGLQDQLSDARVLQDRGRQYIGDMFAQAAAAAPIVIILEDIHWADAQSLVFFHQFLRANVNRPVMVVALARPVVYRRHPDWENEQRDYHLVLELRPLVRRDIRRMVNTMLRQMATVPPELHDLIARVTEGNPYYIEEVIKMLIDEEVIVRYPDRWEVAADRLERMDVPPSLTGVIQARLDSLSREERDTLQRAAVIGRTFWDEAVGFLGNGQPQSPTALEGVLDALIAREMIQSHEQASFANTREFSFKHNLLREVAYEGVLRRVRRNYHRRAADWLVANSGERISEYTYLIAEHFYQAGQASQAVDFLSRAGEKAFQVSAYREAAKLLERALYLVDPGQVITRAGLRRRLGHIYWRIGWQERAKTTLEAALEDYSSLGESPGHAEVLGRLGVVSLSLGEYARAREHLDACLAMARRHDDKRNIARSLDGLANLALALGEYQAAGRFLQESLPIARDIGDRWHIANALKLLGLAAQRQNDLTRARTYYMESMAIFRAMEHRWGIATALASLGDVAIAQAAPDAARRYFQEGLSLALAIDAAPIALTCVAGIARLLVSEENAAERAAELVAMVLNHPARDREVDERALPLLATLQGLLPAQRLGACTERGKSLDLEATIRTLLTEREVSA